MKTPPPTPLHQESTVILESISDGVFTVDPSWRVTYFNRAAEEITGVPRSEALGRFCWEVFKSSMCEDSCALKATMNTGMPIIGKPIFIINAQGEQVPLSISTAVLRDKRGSIIGGAETFRDLREVETLRDQLKGLSKVGTLISKSPQMKKIFEILPAVAQSGSTILILGETGTGKNLLAQTIHQLSPQKEYPFVVVNCAALPETLLESELFGYKKGAFTGASRDKPGKVALAEGGTLMLDEIAELGGSLQAKLLKLLQDKEYEPLGALKPEKAHLRIITATNSDLEELVKEKRFREDLYYRIKVVPLELPPLRDRKEDIPFLVDQFIEKFNKLQNRSVKGVTQEALSFMMIYNWPGNIRELENVIERAFILCGNSFIAVNHLPREIVACRSIPSNCENIRKARHFTETQLIEETLRKNDYNRVKTAKELGIHKATLYRKIKKLGLSLPSKKELA